MSEHVRSAIITGAVGLGIVLFVRLGMRVAFAGYLHRFSSRRSAVELAILRTRFTILQRLVFAILLVIVSWSVLQIFPTTNALARSLLASGAVLTLFVGIALSGPLSNIGAGVLLGLAQPVRLGDRVTLGDTSGTAEEITLFHTVLVTDDGRRVFVPNAQLTSSIITNRSIDDPHRAVSVRLPVALRAPLDRARQTVLDAAGGIDLWGPLDLRVLIGDVTETTVWLTLTADASTGTDDARLASELRERALLALARDELLPT
jgi:small conductance mechanosensitive channel